MCWTYSRRAAWCCYYCQGSVAGPVFAHYYNIDWASHALSPMLMCYTLRHHTWGRRLATGLQTLHTTGTPRPNVGTRLNERARPTSTIIKRNAFRWLVTSPASRDVAWRGGCYVITAASDLRHHPLPWWVLHSYSRRSVMNEFLLRVVYLFKMVLYLKIQFKVCNVFTTTTILVRKKVL